MDKEKGARGFSKEGRVRAYCAVLFCENNNEPLYVQGVFEKIKEDPDFKCKNLDKRALSQLLNGIDIIEKIINGYERKYKIKGYVYEKMPIDLILKNRKYPGRVQDFIDNTMKKIEDEAAKPKEESQEILLN